MNISEAVRAGARVHPDLPALIRPNEQAVSYRMLDQAIDAAGGHLLQYGLRPGQTVSLPIAGPDESLAFIVALALARLGIASADASLPAHCLAAALHQPGGRVPGGVRPIPIDLSWLRGGGARSPESADGSAVLRVFATSGTTGVPKHCALTHAQMASRVAITGYPVRRDSERTVMICAMGLGGTAGLRAALAVLGAGGTLVFTNPDRLATSVLRHKVNFIQTSPHMLAVLMGKLPRGVGPLPTLHAVLCGGSQLPASLARAAARVFCPNIMTFFGATELGSVAVGRYDEMARIPLAIGRLAPGVEAQAIGDAGQVLPPGAEGALRMRAPGMATRYRDDPVTSAEVFRDGWFHSGDLGTVTADGVMIVTGRTGEFINSGGVKVSPRVIEDAILAQPGVTQAAAFGVPDQHGLAQIWAAVVVEPGTDTAGVARAVGTALGTKAPRAIIQLPDLPRNANGKVLVHELVAHAAGLYRRA